MKEIKIYEIPNIDSIERIDDPYIGMIFYVSDIDAYYSVKTLKEINGINMKGSKVVEYVIDEYLDFGSGGGEGTGLTPTQLSNIAKIPAIQSTVDALPNNYASKNHNHSEYASKNHNHSEYASKNHNHSEYASSSHRHDASEIDNLPSGSGTGLTTEQAQQLQTAYEHSQSTHVQASDIPSLEGYATETFVTNNYASKNHNHSGYASSSHRHDASEIDNLPSGGGVSQEDINTAVNNYLTEHPVQSGATTEQAAQIQANKTAIGDANSGLTKEINDIKNIELQNLNTAIQTLETLVGVDETVGDKSELPVGDENIIASINRIDSKTSSDVIVTSEGGNKYKLVVNEHDGTLSAVKIEETTINVTSVSIDKTNPSIKVDESTILTATITPSNATDKTVTWETNNANVSLTPNGLNCTVRGVTEGSSIITVTTNDGNHTATSNITITAKESSGGDQPAGALDASCISYNESYTTYDGDNTFTFKVGLPSWNGLSVPINSGVFKPSTQYTIYCQLLEEGLPSDANNKECTWGVDSHYSATGRITNASLFPTMKSITFTTKDDITSVSGRNFIFLQFTHQLTGYMKVKFYIVEG